MIIMSWYYYSVFTYLISYIWFQLKLKLEDIISNNKLNIKIIIIIFEISSANCWIDQKKKWTILNHISLLKIKKNINNKKKEQFKKLKKK